MTTVDTLTTNLQTCSITKTNRLQKLHSLKKNGEWIKSVENALLEAREMRDFLTFFEKKEILNFFITQDIIFNTYLEMFFYEGWEKEYPDLEALRLVILKSNLQSYCLLEPRLFTDIDDVFKVFQLIIYIYQEILRVIEN
jgi:hypothetical protein